VLHQLDGWGAHHEDIYDVRRKASRWIVETQEAATSPDGAAVCDILAEGVERVSRPDRRGAEGSDEQPAVLSVPSKPANYQSGRNENSILGGGRRRPYLRCQTSASPVCYQHLGTMEKLGTVQRQERKHMELKAICDLTNR
jgi:hypothetical protein